MRILKNKNLVGQREYTSSIQLERDKEKVRYLNFLLLILSGVKSNTYFKLTVILILS